jgi:multidrug efflux system membrane fusion protein
MPNTRLSRIKETIAKRPRAAWTVLGIVLLLFMVWVLKAPTATQPQGRYGAGGPTPVVIATIEKGDIDVTLNALGTVTPVATVTVRPQVSGRITDIAFTEGQMVKKGDFLAEIDPRPYQAALDQAKGTLLRDQALLENALIDLKRYRTLSAQDSIARQTLDAQAALVHQYQGTVKTDQAAVETAALNLDYCHIVSPIDGRVGLRQVDIGNYVQTGDTTGIVVVTQLQPITALFSIPEDSLPAVMKRLQSGATLPATAFDRAQVTKIASGVLATVDNQIDTSTGTVKMRAQFDNKDSSLFPNQFINIELLVDTLKGVTVAPTAAILRGAPGTYVYVVGDDNTVSVRPVTLGETDGDRIEIKAGLAPGEKVVTDGTDRLREGAAVKIPAAAGKASTADTATGNAAAATGGEAPKKAHKGHHKKPQSDQSGSQ